MIESKFRALLSALLILLTATIITLGHTFCSLQSNKVEIDSLKMENHYLQSLPYWLTQDYIECLRETDTASELRVCTANKIMRSQEDE